MNRFKKAIALTVALALSHSAGLQVAQAAMITTEAVASRVSPAEVSSSRAQVMATLQRSDVAQALADKGVDLEDARARVAALSDEQAVALAHDLESAPAGASDVLGAIVFIFVLLLVTDILGLTKVFPFTRSIHR